MWIPTHILARRTRTLDPRGNHYRVMRDFLNQPMRLDVPMGCGNSGASSSGGSTAR